MAWWRRKKGPISVVAFDPAVLTGTFHRPGLVVGGRRLPPIAEPSFTDGAEAQVRATYPAGTGAVRFNAPYYTFAEAGSAVYLGSGGRAAILVCLTPDLRPELDGLDEAIREEGASLYLDAHEGFLRASLLLPSMDFDLDTGLLLESGNTQEFLRAAYATETVELHISHTDTDRLMAVTCAVPRIRAILDAGFDLITRPGPADLPAGLKEVNGSLCSSAFVSLRVTGEAELTMGFDVEI
ncbi:hypothetical protein [Amycolatopsis nigrescens]|uniref:hypothetical protein n=1 Tax=Amycolatopsis nigrescens TaxID=381445 RepID=UPI0012FC0C8B|nr:hypothetical protein [Amycolatopsis nigrescens]